MLAQSLPQPSKLGAGASPSKTFRSATQCVPAVPGQFATPLAHVNLSSEFQAPVQVAGAACWPLAYGNRQREKRRQIGKHMQQNSSL